MGEHIGWFFGIPIVLFLVLHIIKGIILHRMDSKQLDEILERLDSGGKG